MEHFDLVFAQGESANSFALVLGDTNGVHLIMSDGSGCYDMFVDGLVSDWQLVDYGGSDRLEIATEPARLNIPSNFTIVSPIVLQATTSSGNMFVNINLKANEVAKIEANGFISVSKKMSGSVISAVDTNFALLSIASLTMISDWTDYTLNELADMTTDSMMYVEV